MDTLGSGSPVPLGYDGLDYSVYEVLEAENFDLWTPGVIQGGMDRRAKVVKRRGRTVKQTKAHDIENEFIVSFIIFYHFHSFLSSFHFFCHFHL